eukprot:Polyplicarium_translucidae@DN3406_c2_g1_i15.p1
MQRFLIVVLSLSLAWAALDDPPFKFHFHEPGRYFGNPMGAVRFGDKFHFYFATHLEDPIDPGLDDHVMGAVGYATTSDLVHWERQWPVVQPTAGCFIDGGSVVEHEGELVMYYAQRCCDTLDCPTVIFRATSTDGMWWTEGTSVIDFDSDPYLTLPCVVYESARSRWVMTLFGAQDSNGYQPSFYHSPDGLTWTEGGVFVPPAVEGEEGPAHFVVFRNNFLMPMEGKWVMMGTRSDDLINPVALIGTLNEETAVFEPSHVNRGRELFNEEAESPFPVWNHDEYDYVVMNILRPRSGRKPLSLPVAVEAATGSHPDHDYEEYLVGDWPDAVRELIIPSEGEPREEVVFDTSLQMFHPSSVSEDYVYATTGTMEMGFDDAAFLMAEATGTSCMNAIIRRQESKLMWFDDDYTDGKYGAPLLQPPGDSIRLDFAILFDNSIVEKSGSGFFWRTSSSNFRTDTLELTVLTSSTASIRFEAGWTFDVMKVAPVVDRPETPPTPPPTTTTETGALTTTEAPLTTTEAPLTTTEAP